MRKNVKNVFFLRFWPRYANELGEGPRRYANELEAGLRRDANVRHPVVVFMQIDWHSLCCCLFFRVHPPHFCVEKKRTNGMTRISSGRISFGSFLFCFFGSLTFCCCCAGRGASIGAIQFGESADQWGKSKKKKRHRPIQSNDVQSRHLCVVVVKKIQQWPSDQLNPLRSPTARYQSVSFSFSFFFLLTDTGRKENRKR